MYEALPCPEHTALLPAEAGTSLDFAMVPASANGEQHPWDRALSTHSAARLQNIISVCGLAFVWIHGMAMARCEVPSSPLV